MIFVFIMFIGSDHLGSCFLYSWQSICDFMEYILFDFSVSEQKYYGKIVLEAAWHTSQFWLDPFQEWTEPIRLLHHKCKQTTKLPSMYPQSLRVLCEPGYLKMYFVVRIRIASATYDSIWSNTHLINFSDTIPVTCFSGIVPCHWNPHLQITVAVVACPSWNGRPVDTFIMDFEKTFDGGNIGHWWWKDTEKDRFFPLKQKTNSEIWLGFSFVWSPSNRALSLVLCSPSACNHIYNSSTVDSEIRPFADEWDCWYREQVETSLGLPKKLVVSYEMR